MIVRESERGCGWPEIARKSENEREGPSDNAREREGPKKSVSDRVMVRKSERDRVMAINS